MLRRKRIYEDLHPETKHGAVHTGKDKKKFKKSESARGATQSILKKEAVKDFDKPAERFTKVTAEQFDLHERTVQKHVQIAKAIEAKKFDKETIESYKKREISQREMLKRDRVRRDEERKKEQQKKERKEKKRLGHKAAVKAIEEEDIKEAINGVRKEVGIEPIKLCGDCSFTENYNCPNCGDVIISCRKSTMFKLVESGTEACEDFKK